MLEPADSSEQCLFSLQAQVYALDKTQKWTPLTKDIVTVSFLFNEQTGLSAFAGLHRAYFTHTLSRRDENLGRGRWKYRRE
jgi:hypothetical protein